MKTKLTVLLMSFLLLMQGFTFLEAQVTIGDGSTPEKGALLELKEKNASSPVADNILSLENSFKGFLYPKVSLKAWNQLTPLYGGTDDGNGNWTDESTDQEKLLATGMVVYNVNEEATDLDEGLYMWRIEEWVKLSGGMGQAQFDPVDCSAVKVNGYYVEGKDVAGSEYLTIKLNVKKAGSFSISAASGNGYSYYISGVALEKGPLTVNVPCQGTPSLVQTDDLVLTGVDLVAGCTPQVTVNTATATYSINCSSIEVKGRYLKGTALTASNYITVSINVSVAGSYYITTPLTNGIRFSSVAGELALGTQVVTLYGEGTPTVNLDFPIEINTNSPEGNTTCTAAIPVTLPRLTYALIGNNGTYSWSGIRRTALTNGTSFGPDGIVKTLGLSELWSTNSATTAIENLKNQVPDIVLYFAYGAPNSVALSSALADYVNKGGVLVFAANSDGNGSSTGLGLTNAKTLLDGIFGSNTAEWQTRCTENCPSSYPNDDNDYLIVNLPDNPIVNGSFGNLASRYWGEDNDTNGTVVVRELPTNSVQICSASNNWGHTGVDPSYSVVWYNESKNFFMFGDTTGAAANNTDRGGYPSNYSSVGMPLSKAYGNGNNSNSPFVFNSALELNVVAWALRKAASAGINPH